MMIVNIHRKWLDNAVQREALAFSHALVLIMAYVEHDTGIIVNFLDTLITEQMYHQKQNFRNCT